MNLVTKRNLLFVAAGIGNVLVLLHAQHFDSWRAMFDPNLVVSAGIAFLAGVGLLRANVP